jgi:preprotein translocase subunit SecG
LRVASLHRDDGFVFILMALAILGLMLVLLQRPERVQASTASSVRSSMGIVRKLGCDKTVHILVKRLLWMLGGAFLLYQKIGKSLFM